MMASFGRMMCHVTVQELFSSGLRINDKKLKVLLCLLSIQTFKQLKICRMCWKNKSDLGRQHQDLKDKLLMSWCQTLDNLFRALAEMLCLHLKCCFFFGLFSNKYIDTICSLIELKSKIRNPGSQVSVHHLASVWSTAPFLLTQVSSAGVRIDTHHFRLTFQSKFPGS